MLGQYSQEHQFNICTFLEIKMEKTLLLQRNINFISRKLSLKTLLLKQKNKFMMLTINRGAFGLFKINNQNKKIKNKTEHKKA